MRHKIIYSSFWKRLLAVSIDWFLLTGLYILLIYFEKHIFPLPGISFWLYILLYFAFEVYLTKVYGGTVGRLLLGIYIVDAKTGKKLSWQRSIGRHLAEYVSAFILLVGYIFILADRKKRALHDIIAGTLSVDKPSKNHKKYYTVVVLIGTPLLLISLVFLGMSFYTGYESTYNSFKNMYTPGQESYSCELPFLFNDLCEMMNGGLGSMVSDNPLESLENCDNIYSNSHKTSCYTLVAMTLGNESICDGLDHNLAISSCKRQLRKIGATQDIISKYSFTNEVKGEVSFGYLVGDSCVMPQNFSSFLVGDKICASATIFELGHDPYFRGDENFYIWVEGKELKMNFLMERYISIDENPYENTRSKTVTKPGNYTAEYEFYDYNSLSALTQEWNFTVMNESGDLDYIDHVFNVYYSETLHTPLTKPIFRNGEVLFVEPIVTGFSELSDDHYWFEMDFYLYNDTFEYKNLDVFDAEGIGLLEDGVLFGAGPLYNTSRLHPGEYSVKLIVKDVRSRRQVTIEDKFSIVE